MFKSKEAELRLQEADKVKGLYRRQDLRFLETFFPFFFLEISNCNRHTQLTALFSHAGFINFYFKKYFFLFLKKNLVFHKNKNET